MLSSAYWYFVIYKSPTQVKENFPFRFDEIFWFFRYWILQSRFMVKDVPPNESYAQILSYLLR